MAVLGVAALALLLGGAGRAAAQFSITITADENGTGTFTNTSGFFSPLPAATLPDPGPGGLPAALTYGLLNPPGLVAGDVLVVDPLIGLSDWIRFNPQQNGGSLVFYSFPGGTDLADLAGSFPADLYANSHAVLEAAADGAITYTPTAGQPGFVTGAAGPITYNLTSPEEPSPSPPPPPGVPEPSSLALFALGGALAVWRWRRGIATA
jgi:hypothetical protein